MRSAIIVAVTMVIGCSPDAKSARQDALGNVVQPVAGPSPADAGNSVRSGPFGLAMGQPIGELQFADAADTDPTQARTLASVPRPLPELKTYAVIAYPETGVCEIRTVSETFDSDAYGTNVRSAIDALSDSLDAKYGKHAKNAFCSSAGSCEYFQMGLKDGSQGYGYTWSRETGATLPAEVEEVSLFAMPGEFNNTFFRLDYASSATEACRNASRKAKAAAL